MLTWLTDIGGRVLVWLAAAGAVIVALLLLVGKLMSAGRAKEQAEQAKRNDEMRRQADEVDRTVDGASDAELDRMRDEWTRR